MMRMILVFTGFVNDRGFIVRDKDGLSPDLQLFVPEKLIEIRFAVDG